MSREFATIGGGCFWGIEHLYREIPGVFDAVSGYEAGELENPTYRDVCTGRTGHAEVVRVEFDPDVVSYKELLH
ncbi:MAG: peptide-methionine (S)-S-oxide reductase, partial [Fimbriimonadaceae bacterium]|nr:peptide-methionine (S)-S-oxide reductase [Fimbriimonadaceae bacterium]